MKSHSPAFLLLAAASLALSQESLSELKCPDSLSPGTDTVIFTVPYTYTQVLSIIGDYSNLTWSGSPAGSVTLNGTDNTVGTARSYTLLGANLVETIKTYSKPAAGPYLEIHDLGLLTIPSLNLTISAPYDGTVVEEVCGGQATQFNLTALYCASNATLAGSVFHQAHMTDAQTVGVFLGGMNFTSCAALGGSAGPTGTGTGVVTPTGSQVAFTGAAVRMEVGLFAGGLGALAAVLL